MKAIKIISVLFIIVFFVLFVSITPGKGCFIKVETQEAWGASWEFLFYFAGSYTIDTANFYYRFIDDTDNGITAGVSGVYSWGENVVLDSGQVNKYTYYYVPDDPNIIRLEVSGLAGRSVRLERMYKFNCFPLINVTSPTPNGTLFPSFNRAERGV